MVSIDGRKAEDYLWEGLDLKNFEVIGIHPQTQDRAVIIMYDKRADSKKRWCLQFRGSGRYFETAEEALDYFRSRGWRFFGN